MAASAQVHGDFVAAGWVVAHLDHIRPGQRAEVARVLEMVDDLIDACLTVHGGTRLHLQYVTSNP
jgi:hypothetical protein